MTKIATEDVLVYKRRHGLLLFALSALLCLLPQTSAGDPANALHLPAPNQAQEPSIRLETAAVVTVTGPSNGLIELQSTDALHPKAVWASLTNAIPPIRFTDVSTPQTATRFYRVRANQSEPQAPPPGFAWLPPGGLTRGSSVTQLDRDADAGPQSVVTLIDGFWMSQHEATQDEFLAGIGSNPSYFKGFNLPVERLGWPETTNYRAKLTALEAGKGAALGNPTPVRSHAPALSTNPTGPPSGRGFGSIGFQPVIAPQIPPRPPTPLALATPASASPEVPFSFSIHLAPLLTLNAPLGSQLRIEWTDSPVDPGLWKAFTNLTVVSNPTRFVDLTAPNHSQRRYRLHIIPAEPAGRPQGFVWIPPGTFTLGSPGDEVDHGWESPQTEVTISNGFWMSRYEVSQKEFHAILPNHKNYWQGDDLPAESLNWHQANEYCTQLTQRAREAGTLPAGFVYRLPTEAEWEYACRAGSSTRFSYGDDPLYTQLANYAWFIGNAGAKTHPVGSKTPNPWGLYDMHGNVWEWCQDWYGAHPGGQATDPRTLIPSFAGLYRTVRGGCWGNVGGGCRSGSRNGFGPDHPYWGIGLRPVLARPLQN